MGVVERLIAELCLNGVKYKTVGDVATITRGRVMSKDYIKENYGIYPVYSSQTENYGELGCISTYDFDGEYLTWTTDGANAGSIFYRKGRFSITNVCGLIKVSDDTILTRFLYFVLSVEAKKYVNSGMGNPKLMSNVMAKVKIPIPPLEVQQEIVRIMDQFTELTAELTTKLNAELAARKKQYEYYRDALFFVENSEYILIKDLATTNIGLATSVTKHKVENGILLLHNSDIQQNRIVLKQCEYISEGFAQKNTKKLLRKDDIITVHTGDVGTSAVIDGPYIGAIGFTTITTRINDNSKIIPQYLCHYLNSRRCKADIAAMTISDRNNLNQKDFDKLVIPVPPLEEQYHIVSILDRLETFCNNLSSGLPAEIEARRKQYEYYRDKLFTFKELEV